MVQSTCTCKFTPRRLSFLTATKTFHNQIVSLVKILVSVMLVKGYICIYFAEFDHGYTITVSEIDKCFQDFLVTGFL